MLKRLLRDRKGVSITEIVVAMAVVLMITGAAISVVLASAKADATYNNKYRALTACENAAECIRYSQGNESLLKNALKEAGFTIPIDASPFLEIGDDSIVVYRDLKDGFYMVVYNGEEIYKSQYKRVQSEGN